MGKKIILLIITLIPLISFSQNQLIIEPNLNVGTLQWIEKYYIENVDDTSDPLALQQNSFILLTLNLELNIYFKIEPKCGQCLTVGIK